MAISKNSILKGVSGKIGNLFIVRQQGGKTVISSFPRASSKPPSKRQAENRLKFKKAMTFAKNILEVPEYLALYKAKARIGKSALNSAVSDFMHPPEIKKIHTHTYTGHPGDIISVDAFAGVKATEVVVRIKDAEKGAGFTNPFMIDLGPGKGVKQILFDKPEIKPLNAIKKELESFYSAIINNTIPPVTINDGYSALEVAYKVIEKISQSANNL